MWGGCGAPPQVIVLAVLAVLGDLLDPVFWLSSFDDLPPNPSRNQQPVASSPSSSNVREALS